MEILLHFILPFRESLEIRGNFLNLLGFFFFQLLFNLRGNLFNEIA